MILDKYTPEELAAAVDGVQEMGAIAYLVLEIQRLSKELEEVKEQTKKKSVGRPRGSFKGEGPSKGYKPVEETLPLNGVHDDSPSH